MPKTIHLVLLFFLFLAGGNLFAQVQTETVTVDRVMDGDTFRLSNGQKLKLAGVNAPELHDTPKLPQEAKRFKKETWAFRQLAAEAEQIAQRFVKQTSKQILIETATQTFDERENLLGYVYLTLPNLEPGMEADGTIITAQSGGYQIFLNAYLLKLGLAELAPASLDSKYKDLFVTLEAEAKSSKKGLWS